MCNSCKSVVPTLSLGTTMMKLNRNNKQRREYGNKLRGHKVKRLTNYSGIVYDGEIVYTEENNSKFIHLLFIVFMSTIELKKFDTV